MWMKRERESERKRDRRLERTNRRKLEGWTRCSWGYELNYWLLHRRRLSPRGTADDSGHPFIAQAPTLYPLLHSLRYYQDSSSLFLSLPFRTRIHRFTQFSSYTQFIKYISASDYPVKIVPIFLHPWWNYYILWASWLGLNIFASSTGILFEFQKFISKIGFCVISTDFIKKSSFFTIRTQFFDKIPNYCLYSLNFIENIELVVISASKNIELFEIFRFLCKIFYIFQDFWVKFMFGVFFFMEKYST